MAIDYRPSWCGASIDQDSHIDSGEGMTLREHGRLLARDERGGRRRLVEPDVLVKLRRDPCGKVVAGALRFGIHGRTEVPP